VLTGNEKKTANNPRHQNKTAKREFALSALAAKTNYDDQTEIPLKENDGQAKKNLEHSTKRKRKSKGHSDSEHEHSSVYDSEADFKLTKKSENISQQTVSQTRPPIQVQPLNKIVLPAFLQESQMSNNDQIEN
jgi:hypothetical protein